MRMRVQRAVSAEQIAACERLIVSVYSARYGVIFSEEVDPDQKREPLPHHYAFGSVDGQMIAAAGLYTRFTYAERFGRLSEEELSRAVTAAGCPEAISRPRVEYTKVVVRPEWEGRGIGRFFIGATHSRYFLTAASDETPLVFIAAKLSTFGLWTSVGIRTRTVKPFPLYKSQERYRTPDDPMESRIVIPELDIDPRWYRLRLPGSVEIELPGEQGSMERAAGA